MKMVGDKFELKLSGFNDKLSTLLSMILSATKSFSPNVDRFEMDTDTLLYLANVSRKMDLGTMFTIFAVLPSDISSSSDARHIVVMWAIYLFTVLSILLSSFTTDGCQRLLLYTDISLRDLRMSAIASYVFAILAVEMGLAAVIFAIEVRLGKPRCYEVGWIVITVVGCALVELVVYKHACMIYKACSGYTRRKGKALLPVQQQDSASTDSAAVYNV